MAARIKRGGAEACIYYETAYRSAQGRGGEGGIYREYCIREFPYLSPLDVDAREGLQDGRL